MDINGPKTLKDAIEYFADEQRCIDAVAALRWPNGKPVCPSCGHMEHYYLKTQKRWKCKECWKQFSVKVGTVMESSPVSLSQWLLAMWMLSNCRNGVSSYEGEEKTRIKKRSHKLLKKLQPALQKVLEPGEAVLQVMHGRGSLSLAEQLTQGW